MRVNGYFVMADLLPVSWPRIIRAVEKVRNRLLRATNALENASIPYAVTEDHAVAAWISGVDGTAVRNSPDIHILLRRKDFCAAKRILDGVAVDVLIEGSRVRQPEVVYISFAGEKVREDSHHPLPDISESEQTDHFRILSLEALVRMKLNAFRDKDRTHLRDLIEVGLLDRSILERLPAELRTRMQHLFDTPEG
jgi:hypothetical protein